MTTNPISHMQTWNYLHVTVTFCLVPSREGDNIHSAKFSFTISVVCASEGRAQEGADTPAHRTSTTYFGFGPVTKCVHTVCIHREATIHQGTVIHSCGSVL